jgi:hypothetical protein
MLVASLVLACSSTQSFNPTPKFSVNVDGLRDPSAPARTRYVLIPAIQNVRESDLQFKEFSGYLRNALTSKGFQEAASPQEADVAILVVYGIVGEPKAISYSYSIPVFGLTGGGTATYSGSTQGPGGSSISSGTIHQPAQFGVVGVRSDTSTVTTYFRFLTLEAIDLAAYRKSQTVVPVWKTNITSTGSSGDLRLVFPIMLGAAADHLGSNTGRQVVVELSDEDVRVRRVKGLR